MNIKNIENKTLKEVKEELLLDIQNRKNKGLIENNNAILLEELINNADNVDKAMAIAHLGTTYRPTGLHYDKRLEVQNDNIQYLKRNSLSFKTNEDSITHKLIIGDNYPALLNLLIQYREKIDVIYIDPPYGCDSMGKFADTNYKNAITRDNLLSMLYPRFLLAKQLLSKTGVIFVSIDERNHAYLKCLMDDIFGEFNYIGSPIRQKNKLVMKGDKTFKNILEPLIVYAKNKKNVEFSYTKNEEVNSDFSMISSSYEEKTIIFEPGKLNFRIETGFVPKGTYNNQIINNDITIKDHKNLNSVSITGRFKWSQSKINEKLNANAYVLIKKIDTMALRIHFVGNSAKPLDFIDSKYGNVTNEDGKKMLEDIFSENVFDYPKPVDFIKFLLNIYDDESAIVLDFFAGSGTTGQAVLEMNKEDGGSRQFILYTNNEKEDGYIAETVTSKRLKRIMTGECYDGTNDFKWIKDNEPYGDNLDVYDIKEIYNVSQKEDENPLIVIDETIYGEKFDNLIEKAEWIYRNFDKTQKHCPTFNIERICSDEKIQADKEE